MKKLLTALLSLALLGTAALPALAAENGLPVAPTSTQKEDASSGRNELPTGWTIEIDDKAVEARARIMVPLRAIAEQLGFTVTWDIGNPEPRDCIPLDTRIFSSQMVPKL